jgi:hypothetical protein
MAKPSVDHIPAGGFVLNPTRNSMVSERCLDLQEQFMGHSLFPLY